MKCLAFRMENIETAWEHMNLEIMTDYGDYAYGHCLHAWDDGKRMLARCRTCGGYVMIQKSEFHSFSGDSDDSYYTDYFPVENEKEADKLNQRYSGSEIERVFPERYMCMTNFKIYWSR